MRANSSATRSLVVVELKRNNFSFHFAFSCLCAWFAGAPLCMRVYVSWAHIFAVLQWKLPRPRRDWMWKVIQESNFMKTVSPPFSRWLTFCGLGDDSNIHDLQSVQHLENLKVKTKGFQVHHCVINHVDVLAPLSTWGASNFYRFIATINDRNFLDFKSIASWIDKLER